MYSYERTIKNDAESVYGKLASSLKNAGYIILSYVDVKQILENNFKLKASPYFILNVCKPEAAKELIGENEEMGLFLPCKIVLIEKGQETRVLMLKVSEMARTHLNMDGKTAEKYENELIEVLKAL